MKTNWRDIIPWRWVIVGTIVLYFVAAIVLRITGYVFPWPLRMAGWIVAIWGLFHIYMRNREFSDGFHWRKQVRDINDRK